MMDSAAVFLSIIGVSVGLLIVALKANPEDQRNCLGCGEKVACSAGRCRSCGYRFQ